MFPIAQGSYIFNLGQIGQNVTKLSIKAVKKMMNLEGVARGKIKVWLCYSGLLVHRIRRLVNRSLLLCIG